MSLVPLEGMSMISSSERAKRSGLAATKGGWIPSCEYSSSSVASNSDRWEG